MTLQELSPNPVHSIGEALIGEKMLDQKGNWFGYQEVPLFHSM